MPSIWRDHLDAQGWQVNRVASLISWQCLVLTRLAHGILVSLKMIGNVWRGAEAKKNLANLSAHVVFESLTIGNLPTLQRNQQSFDICSFYAQWSGRDKDILSICHNVPNAGKRYAGNLPVVYRPPVYQLAAGKMNAIRLALWSFCASIYATIMLLCGRWEYAMLLAEAVKSRSVRLCDRVQLAKEYLFHFSGTVYRPMWTYEAQRHGASISLYFYSNYDQPKLEQGYENQCFEWGPANWPRYIVFDEQQESILRLDLGSDIKIVHSGAIYFSDSAQPLPYIPPNSVAVFNIQPHRPTSHFGISTLADCLAEHKDFYHRFLEDVTEVIKSCSGHMVLKGKRNIYNNGDKKYARIVDAISRQGHVQILDPDISAIRLILECSAGISVPFTSTGIYLRDLGIPCAYYDPYGWIQKDDKAARGIPIVQGKSDLHQWLAQILRVDENNTHLYV
jgi:polysaccharide biosynthesis PFTS motif protein